MLLLWPNWISSAWHIRSALSQIQEWVSISATPHWMNRLIKFLKSISILVPAGLWGCSRAWLCGTNVSEIKRQSPRYLPPACRGSCFRWKERGSWKSMVRIGNPSQWKQLSTTSLCTRASCRPAKHRWIVNISERSSFSGKSLIKLYDALISAFWQCVFSD